jgi:hypothetical protein
VRESFAHEAVLTMSTEDDLHAPGAAITVSLCGHWEHDPPCPLAPHHTAAERDDELVRLRVLFATDPETEPEVRRRIDDALARGQLVTREGAVARWRLVRTRAAVVRPEEAEHARRLAAS